MIMTAWQLVGDDTIESPLGLTLSSFSDDSCLQPAVGAFFFVHKSATASRKQRPIEFDEYRSIR